MLLRKFSYIVFLNLIAIASFAQAPKGMGKSDPEAKKVLDAVSAKFKTFKTVKASFTLKIEDATGKVQGSKTGTVMMKGVKYRVSITGQEIFCDGATIWTYDVAAKEVQVSALDNSSGSITPQKLFTNFYDKEYKYSYKGDIKEAGKSCDLLELIPNDKSKQLVKIELMIEKSSSTIIGGNYWEKNGNKYKIAISNYTPNANIPDTYFAWNPKDHPGVETVDLR